MFTTPVEVEATRQNWSKLARKMAAKRKNPFGECTPMQLKTHVGPKEAASIEEQERIHAHTKALLFRGANPTASYAALKAVGGVNGFMAAHKPVKQLEQTLLSCVHCKGQVTLTKCSDCSKCVCSSCVRQCSACGETFCQLCTVLNYLQYDVHSFCLNCLQAHSAS